MLKKNVMYSDSPEQAVIYPLSDGNAALYLRGNIREEISVNEDGEEQVIPCADEAYMIVPADEVPEQTELESQFDAWYQKAALWEPKKSVPAPSLEERVNAMEEAMLAMMEG